MTPHQYLAGILNEQKMLPQDMDTLQRLRDEIESQLRTVYGQTPRFYYGGSYGKNTLVRASFDLDIVMYFPSTDNRSLRELSNSVYQTLVNVGYTVTPKNVALRLPYQGGFHIDVVPGRAQDTSFYSATLYKREEDSTRQTSIKQHIDSVRNSNAREIIRIIKLWRLRHSLDWMSFGLEQVVIRALAGQTVSDYGTATMNVMAFIRDNITAIRLVDPANTNNVIEMSPTLRQELRAKAMASIAASNWGTIVW